MLIRVTESDIRSGQRRREPGARLRSCPIATAIKRQIGVMAHVNNPCAEWLVVWEDGSTEKLPAKAAEFARNADKAYFDHEKIDLEPFTFSIKVPECVSKSLKKTSTVAKTTQRRSRVAVAAR